MRDAIGARDDRGTRARRRTGWGGVAVLLPALAAVPAAVLAQDVPPPAIVLVGGAFQYDLIGEGTVPFGGLRLDLPMTRYLHVEPGFAYTRYTSDDGDDIPHLIAEVHLQGAYPLGRWRPYLGAGIGAFFDLREQRGGSALVRSTFSAAVGGRFDVGRGWGVRAEVRIRSLDETLIRSATEYAVGFSRSF